MSDPGQYPVDVAVLENGEFVAVTNILSTSGRPGSVTLYKKGKAVRTISSSSRARVYFDGFDAKGNLYVDGENSNGDVVVGEIAKLTTSGKTIKTLTYNGTIGFPGAVVVTTASKIAVADQIAGVIHTYNPPKNGSLGNPIYTTPLAGSSDPVTLSAQQGRDKCELLDTWKPVARQTYSCVRRAGFAAQSPDTPYGAIDHAPEFSPVIRIAVRA